MNIFTLRIIYIHFCLCRKTICEIVHSAFNKAELYAKRFDPIRQNFEIDFNTDPETIKMEKNVERLRELSIRYNQEMEDLEGIVPIINLGLFELKQDTFKEKIIPICQNLLVVLDTHVPK